MSPSLDREPSPEGLSASQGDPGPSRGAGTRKGVISTHESPSGPSQASDVNPHLSGQPPPLRAARLHTNHPCGCVALLRCFRFG